jgi:hypothetical protein
MICVQCGVNDADKSDTVSPCCYDCYINNLKMPKFIAQNTEMVTDKLGWDISKIVFEYLDCSPKRINIAYNKSVREAKKLEKEANPYYKCGCGSIIKKDIPDHYKTKKHTRWLHL